MPVDEETLKKRWGLYLKQVGLYWEADGAKDSFAYYVWTVPGVEMEMRVGPYGAPPVMTTTMRWNEERQMVETFSDGKQYDSPIAPYDSYTPEWQTVVAEDTRIKRRLEGNRLETVIERKAGETFQPSTHLVMTAYTEAQLVERAQQQERERLAAEQAEEARRVKRGQVLGTLLVAGAGAAMVDMSGGNAQQVIGGALKGAEIANPESAMASALGAQGTSMLSSGAASASAATGGGRGSTTPGSYPTQGNLALSSCAGFTEGNYREKALSGGGDQQLYSMCGQAFEYYVMYKRAIAQGYSESEANRTYEAHRKSAAVAAQFLRDSAAKR
jgi:hypothetical protein